MLILTTLLFFTAIFASNCTSIKSHYYAKAVMYPNRQPIPKTPKDYGLEFEKIDFKSSDDVLIKAWLIPGTTEKLVIMTHPGSFNKYGWSPKGNPTIGGYPYDKEVEFMNTAKQLQKQGYWVFTFDFRNQGESGEGDKGITGVGLYEATDVLGAVHYVKKDERLKNKSIAFLSFCQGANATIMALSKYKQELKTAGIKALILVQPIAAKEFIYTFAKAEDVANEDVLIAAEEKCIKRGGPKWDDMNPVPYAKDIFVPTLHIQAKTDRWVRPEHVKDIYNAIPQPKQMLWIEDKMERFDTYNYFSQHPEAILSFLQKNM